MALFETWIKIYDMFHKGNAYKVIKYRLLVTSHVYRCREPFHKCFVSLSLKSWWKSFWNCFYSKGFIRSQFCTCHDSLAVVTCTNLWPEWFIRLIITAHDFFQLFAHRPLVKWAPRLTCVIRCDVHAHSHRWTWRSHTRNGTDSPLIRQPRSRLQLQYR